LAPGLYYAIHSGSAEEIVLTSLPINGDIYQAVKKWVPSVINVACWPARRGAPLTGAIATRQAQERR
jgi:hypothetical protein